MVIEKRLRAETEEEGRSGDPILVIMPSHGHKRDGDIKTYKI